MQAHIGKIDSISDMHWTGGLATVVYFAGCDYNCPFCNVSDILLTKDEFVMDLKAIKKTIRENQGSIKAVVFTGGEPCLQRQPLLSLASFVKDLNIKTALETNGSKVECIRSLLRLELIDLIALDIKAPFEEAAFENATRSKTFFKDSESLLRDLKKTIRLLETFQDKINIEIRTTITPTLVYRKEDLMKIASSIEHLHSTWVLRQYKPDNVADKNFSGLNAPSVQFLDNLRQSVQKKYPKLRVALD